MRDLYGFLRFAGLVLLVFGLIAYGATLRFDLWTAVHVAGGGILLAAGILLNLAGFVQQVRARGTRERVQAITGTLLFIAILVTANVLAERYPWRFDATENQVHTLSGKTLRVLQELREPTEILAFHRTGSPARGALEELLDRFGASCPKLTWRFVDPEREPQLADQLGVRREGAVVVRSSRGSAQDAGSPEMGVTEGSLASLILKVSRPGSLVLYVLTGHGEASADDLNRPEGLGALAAALREENFQVRPLLLSTRPEVPGDATLVLVAGARKALLPHEVEALRRYLAQGGRALLLLDPETDSGLGPLLTDFRIELGDDLIVDQEVVPFLGARLGLDPIVEDFVPHAVTREFKERIVLFRARSVHAGLQGGLGGVEAQVLARTRAGSWAERQYREAIQTGRVSKDAEDLEGPVPVAVASWLAGQKGESEDSGRPSGGARLVVLGDSDLASNANLSAFFNRDFILNAVQWLAGGEDLIAERPRGLRPSRLDMTESDYRTLFRLGVLLLPEALLLIGVAIWWRRRTL